MSMSVEQIESVYAITTSIKKYTENMLSLVMFPISSSLFMLVIIPVSVIQNSLIFIGSLVAFMVTLYIKRRLFWRYEKKRSAAHARILTNLPSLKSKTFGRKISYKNKYMAEKPHSVWCDYPWGNALNFSNLYVIVNVANYSSLVLLGAAFLFVATNIGGAYWVIPMSPLFLMGAFTFYSDIEVVTEVKGYLELAEISTKQEKFVGEFTSESKDHVLLANMENISELKLPTGLDRCRVEIEIPRKDISVIKRYIFYESRDGGM